MVKFASFFLMFLFACASPSLSGPRSGKKLWFSSGTCRPAILGQSRKILCYHDDADSNIAFDVYSGEGAGS